MAVHHNGHLLCAIDVETTGLDPEKHEIIQIAIVPLTYDYEVSREFTIFDAYIAPGHRKRISDIERKAMSVNKIELDKLLRTGMDPWKVSELLEEWFEGLKLPVGKKLLPLAHNWPHEHKFLFDWLGQAMMEMLFFTYRDPLTLLNAIIDSPFKEAREAIFPPARDTLSLANALNDIADMINEPWPFPKVSLTYLCSQLKVVNTNPHNALGDAVATAGVYKKLIKMMRKA